MPPKKKNAKPQKRKLVENMPVIKRGKKQKAIDLDRERIQLEVTQPERRLDSLATLLESKSQCIAVSVINKKIYITANELNEAQGDSSVFKSIKKIMEYFVDLSRNAHISEKRRTDIFREICSIERFRSATKGGVRLNKTLVQKTVTLFLSRRRISSMALKREFRDDAGSAGYVYGCCSNLYHDFVRLENTLKNAPLAANSAAASSVASAAASGGESKAGDEATRALSNEILEAFRGHNFEILLEEPVRSQENPLRIIGESKEKAEGLSSESSDDESQEAEEENTTVIKVHAEVQLLSKIIAMIEKGELHVEKNKQVIYLGISKLCCVSCRKMLDNANKGLAKYAMVINDSEDNEKTKRQDQSVGGAAAGGEASSEHNVELKTRGRHDLSFPWFPPHRFANGYYALESEKYADEDGSLAFKIGRATKLDLDKTDLKKKFRGRRIQADDSGSDVVSVEGDGREIAHEQLKITLQTFQHLKNKYPDFSVQNVIDVIEIVNELHSLDQLSTLSAKLFEKEVKNKTVKDNTRRIFRLLTEKIDELNKQKLESRIPALKFDIFLEILTDNVFMGTVFAERFEQFVKELNQRVTRRTKRFVPETVLWAVSDNQFVGRINLGLYYPPNGSHLQFARFRLRV